MLRELIWLASASFLRELPSVVMETASFQESGIQAAAPFILGSDMQIEKAI